MIDDRWRQIEHLYHEALACPVEARSIFLRDACAGDAELRAELDSLLQFESVSGPFLERSALEAAAQTLSATRLGLRPPEIPGYRIIRELGEGGMGVVYLAEQESPLRRLVALKLIRPGMDSRQILARFDAERQALALMDHPNIAAVFGAGSTNDGRPYFVMEFVDGVPITEYCDRGKLSTKARLDLFTLVCAAVQHAHQKGVIHRDIKPSNVLVATLDDRAVPKVIDFGTAKAVAHAADKRLTLTGQGTALGTIEYMSPEQAGFSTDIDTTTDVYSLGVVLYELLVGALPFELTASDPDGYSELRRAIRESDPPKPSSRVARIDEARGHVLRTRRTDAGLIARELKGDLDSVVLKALEKDRSRRYATVTAFAEDIGRFLVHQPVGARPPSSAYRLRKFGRRHRTGLLMSAGALLVLTVGLLSMVFMYSRVERAQLEAAHRAYAAIIGAADGELRAGAASTARKRLLTIPPEEREFEWKHLFLATDASVATVEWGGASTCPDRLRPAYSQGILGSLDHAGSILVVRCAALEIWDIATLIRTSTRDVSPSAILAANGGDTFVAVPWRFGTPWEAQIVSRSTGKVVSILSPFDSEPLCGDLSADGTHVAIGFAEGKFEIWDARAGRLRFRINTPAADRWVSSAACHVRFNATATAVATSSANVSVWSLEDGSRILQDATLAGWRAQPVAFNSDGRHMVIGRPTRRVDIIDIRRSPKSDGNSAGSGGTSGPGSRGSIDFGLPTAMRDETTAVTFSADDRHVISANGVELRVWEVVPGTNEPIARNTLTGNSADVVGLLALGGSRRFASADIEGNVKVWALDHPPAVWQVTAPERSFLWLQGGPSLTALARSADGTLQVRSLADQFQEWHRFGSLNVSGLENSLPLILDERRLVAIGRNDVVRVLEIDQNDGTAVQVSQNNEPKCVGKRPTNMVVARESQLIAYASGDCVAVLALPGLQTLATTTFAGDVTALAFGRAGTLVVANATSGGAGAVSVWDWRSKRTIASVPTQPTSRPGVTVSADGSTVAISTRQNSTVSVSIWHGDLTRELGRLTIGNSSSLALSPDGRRMATADGDGAIRIWDTDHLQQLLILKHPDTRPINVYFTENGRLVASDPGAVTIWESERRGR